MDLIKPNQNQEWVKDWGKGLVTRASLLESAHWMRSLSPAKKALLLRFPPSCLVRAIRPLTVPAPGTVGIVASYIEPDDQFPDGSVTVVQSPTDSVRAQRDPKDLVVAGFFKGISFKVVRHLLEAREEDLKL